MLAGLRAVTMESDFLGSCLISALCDPVHILCASVSSFIKNGVTLKSDPQSPRRIAKNILPTLHPSFWSPRSLAGGVVVVS